MPDDITADLDLRRPDVPVTLTELAARTNAGVEITDARHRVLDTVRTHGYQLTHPADWVLFKAPEEHGGQVTAYLQDAGCDRVRDLFGIEVFNITRPEKIPGNEPGQFLYVISGDGRCKLTGQTVEQMEGGRSSTDDFCRDKTGAELELAVRKAARANLDGNITRELAGMKAVPAEELARAWEGSGKKLDACRLGRGFGSRAERLGATAAGAPQVPPPVCGVCGTTAVYRPAANGRGAFYGCPKYQSHRDRKWTKDAEAWLREHAAQAAATAPPPAAAAAPAVCGVCGKPQADHANADHDYGA